MIRRRSRNVGRKRKHFEHLAMMNFVTAIVALNEWEIGSRIGGCYEQVYKHRLFCFHLLNSQGHRYSFLYGSMQLILLQTCHQECIFPNERQSATSPFSRISPRRCEDATKL